MPKQPRPFKNKVPSLETIRQSMERFDDKMKLTRRIQSIAQRKGLPFEIVWDDFGRSLSFYAKIHQLIRTHAFGSLRGKRLVHLGASAGVYTRFLQSIGVQAIPFNLESEHARIARTAGNRRSVVGNARLHSSSTTTPKTRFFPFKDNSIDFFVSDHFLLNRYEKFEGKFAPASSAFALRDLHRILKPNGIGVVYAVDRRDWKAIHQIAPKAGFEIVQSEKPNVKELTFSAVVLRKKA